MKNIRSSRIGAMISVDYAEDLSLSSIIAFLGDLVSSLYAKTEGSESWHFFAKSADKAYTLYRNATEDKSEWSSDFSCVPDDTNWIFVSCQHPSCKHIMSGSVAINKQDEYTNLLDHHKLVFSFVIPVELWSITYGNRFIETFARTACELNAEYACIDAEFLCPKSMSQCNFIRFGKINEHDIHGMVPGIYWGQYLPDTIVDIASISVADSANSIFFVKTLTSNCAKGYWIQLSDPHFMSRNLISQRRALRKALCPFLPNLSPEALHQAMQYERSSLIAAFIPTYENEL